jgi:ankyrin repeat protein
MSTPDIESVVKSNDKEKLERILLSNTTNVFLAHTAFYEAVVSGQYEIFSMLFQKISKTDKFGFDILSHAIVGGNPEIFRCLLTKASTRSFDINMTNKDDSTLLMIAAYTGNMAICSILLENGAKINLENKYFESALYNAIEKDHLETCKFLLRNGAVFSPNLFERAIIKGHTKICSFLLDEGIAQISLSNYIGETSFGVAIGYGHLEICELLFAHGASLDYQDHMHETFLHLACREKKLEIAKFIFENMSTEIATSLNNKEQSAIQVWGRNNIHECFEDEYLDALCIHIARLSSDIL